MVSRFIWYLHLAHPRACGENRHLRRRRNQPQRLIPARAGKTSSTRSPPARPRAHPRACGENIIDAITAREAEGSSPRVRGKLVPSFQGMKQKGLIPARAGKTDTRAAVGSSTGAHPRACGENLTTGEEDLILAGSSPRVRGKQIFESFELVLVGLIPARAGKTPLPATCSNTLRAHPRACGENSEPWCEYANRPGSSPRVRGKRPGENIAHSNRGLIPARAGKTSLLRRSFHGNQAHPRACGENVDVDW